jgi:hypothetical protein
VVEIHVPPCLLMKRSGCATEKEMFDHLYPITFEMWHTAMHFLLLIFKSLFDENSFEKHLAY